MKRGEVALLGLSPHVPGNRNQKDSDAIRQRSIPARAGEPFAGTRAVAFHWVDPRACQQGYLGDDPSPGGAAVAPPTTARDPITLLPSTNTRGGISWFMSSAVTLVLAGIS